MGTRHSKGATAPTVGWPSGDGVIERELRNDTILKQPSFVGSRLEIEIDAFRYRTFFVDEVVKPQHRVHTAATTGSGAEGGASNVSDAHPAAVPAAQAGGVEAPLPESTGNVGATQPSAAVPVPPLPESTGSAGPLPVAAAPGITATTGPAPFDVPAHVPTEVGAPATAPPATAPGGATAVPSKEGDEGELATHVETPKAKRGGAAAATAASTRNPRRKLLCYEFCVCFPTLGRKWKLRKMYFDFVVLRRHLVDVYGSRTPTLPSMPRSLKRPSTTALKSHAAGLGAFLVACLALPRALDCVILREFLELSRTSLDPRLGSRFKEGYLKLASHTVECGGALCVPSMWKRYWFVLRESCVALYENSRSLDPLKVILLDQGTSITEGLEAQVVNCGATACIGAHPSDDQHLLNLTTNEGTSVMVADSIRDAVEWVHAIKARIKKCQWCLPNPLGSYAPNRQIADVKWLVDGRNAMTAMVEALKAARHEILLTGWWLTPDIPMVREIDELRRLRQEKSDDEHGPRAGKRAQQPKRHHHEGHHHGTSTGKHQHHPSGLSDTFKGAVDSSMRLGGTLPELTPAHAAGAKKEEGSHRGFNHKSESTAVEDRSEDPFPSSRTGQPALLRSELDTYQLPTDEQMQSMSLQEKSAALQVTLKQVLEDRARAGVEIYVQMWKEPPLSLALSSAYQKKVLMELGPHVHVMRHGSLFWTHHEKLVVIDRKIAFIGGIDVAWCRWDCGGHILEDVKKDFFSQGLEYYNPSHCDW